MSFGSQLIITIINYISVVGLLICGLLSFFTISKRKKLMLVFFSFLSGGLFYFGYYSSIIFFLVGIIILFFFVLLYLLVFRGEFFGNNKQAGLVEEPKSSRKKEIIIIVSMFVLCLVIGYFVYGYLYSYSSDLTGHLSEAATGEGIFIPALSDISKQISNDYGMVILILLASLFVSSLWFMIIKMEKK
ncbi:MAG: hypothetical protein PHG41_02910 [Actinomycetota bacterium]|nr:hypothetical protein [Actinomycetota bacterium]